MVLLCCSSNGRGSNNWAIDLSFQLAAAKRHFYSLTALRILLLACADPQGLLHTMAKTLMLARHAAIDTAAGLPHTAITSQGLPHIAAKTQSLPDHSGSSLLGFLRHGS